VTPSFSWSVQAAVMSFWDGSHYLTVVANDGEGASSASNEVLALIDTVAPGAPSGFSGYSLEQTALTQGTITWGEVPDAVAYKVYDHNGILLATTAAAEFSVTTNNPTALYVIAVDAAGNQSAPSTEYNVLFRGPPIIL
jgi:hypothetical protein